MSERPPSILLDVSRTVARARLPGPTGIDRVERAYIRWASARGARFLAAFDGQSYLLEVDAVADLLGWLEHDDTRPSLDLRGRLQIQRDRNLRAAQSLVRRSARASTGPGGLVRMLQTFLPGGGQYLNVGHDNLDPPSLLAIAEAGFTRSVMIHDTIPLDHPEYARNGTPEKFRAKLNAALSADLLIANSAHTAGRLRAHGWAGPLVTAPLGIETNGLSGCGAPVHPAFLCLGTIEPRKNHLMLLKLWQKFWTTTGEASPHLILAGRRGWENKATFELLDTAPMMGRTVFEAGTPDDASLRQYLNTSTALLFPSYAEGYGLPLAEALEAGLPAICSDLPALREVGGRIPEYLDPPDTGAWEETIMAYAEPDSRRRSDQLLRLQGWQAPTWRAHFENIANTMETILVLPDRDV